MKIYSQLNTSLMFIDYKPESIIPEGFVLMSKIRPEGDWHAKADGNWYPGDPEKESIFIENEMTVIAEQLLMHEDNDESAIATMQEWRDYRKALRRWNWSDNENFPNPEFRPKRPG